jgi:iron(III) transport system ATP-binding protein
MTTLLDVSNLHSQYDQSNILSGVNFSINKGELCSLLGPSGCGKTTLLRALAGFQAISAGHIHLGEKDITHLTPEQRGIGFVFQDYALFPHLTVSENIIYGIHKKSNARERVTELLTLIELTGFENRYPHELSGGQQQRVALARALAPEPQLLLFDEPFSNLDTELRKSLNLKVRSILKQANLTAILVTHDQTEAFAFGDKVGILNNGQLEQWGSPYTLYHEPTTRFVAEFIGQGQLINAQVKDSHSLQTAFGVIHHQQCFLHDELQLLTRPDDWKISQVGEPVTITNKQFTGTQTLYSVKTHHGETINISTPSHQDYAIGDIVQIKPQFEHIITFT